MADRDDLDYYLTMGESADEASIRSDLAKQGPPYVTMVLRKYLT